MTHRKHGVKPLRVASSAARRLQTFQARYAAASRPADQVAAATDYLRSALAHAAPAAQISAAGRVCDLLMAEAAGLEQSTVSERRKEAC